MSIEFCAMFNQPFEVLDAAVHRVLENLKVESFERREITRGSVEYAIWKTLSSNVLDLQPDPSTSPLAPEPKRIVLPIRHRVVQLAIRNRGQKLSELSVGHAAQFHVSSSEIFTQSERNIRQVTSGNRFESPGLEISEVEQSLFQQQIYEEHFRIVDVIEGYLQNDFEEGEQFAIFLATGYGHFYDKVVTESPKEIIEMLTQCLATGSFKVLYDQERLEEISITHATNHRGEPYIYLSGIPSNKTQKWRVYLGSVRCEPQAEGTRVQVRCTLPTASGAFELITTFFDFMLSPIAEFEDPSARAQHICQYNIATCNKYLEIGKVIHRLGRSPQVAFDKYYKHKKIDERVSLPTIKRAWTHYNKYQNELRERSHDKNDSP